ncbi:MAG: hypothetical protein ABR540_07575 [Acidimicrobiales bacterium]
MTRTARRILPAVAVFAALGTGLGSAAMFGGNDSASKGSTAARSISHGAPATTAAPTTTTVAPATTAAPTGPRPSSATSARVAEAPPGPLPGSDRVPDEHVVRPCGSSDGEYRPATEGEFRAAMTGAWLLCQSPSFFGTDEAGMELRADGRWSKLYWLDDGSLVRAEGPGTEGAWIVTDVSAMNGRPTFQVDFQADGTDAVSMALPAFGEGASVSTVSTVRLNNMGLFIADYVPVPPGTTIHPSPSSPPSTPDRCDKPGKHAYSPSTEAEFRETMTRAWLLCGAPSFFGTDEAGMEIRADGRWSKLFATSWGSLVRGTGPGNEGTWESVDASGMNGTPTFQIDFHIDGGGSIGTVPAFAKHGSKISNARLDNMGFFVADYVPAPRGTPISGS